MSLCLIILDKKALQYREQVAQHKFGEGGTTAKVSVLMERDALAQPIHPQMKLTLSSEHISSHVYIPLPSLSLQDAFCRQSWPEPHAACLKGTLLAFFFSLHSIA